MTYSSVGILAILVHVLVNFSVLFGRSEEKRTSSLRAYRFFLFSLTAFYVSDVLWGVLYENGLLALCYADTVVYFIVMALSVLLWMRYVICYLRLTGKSRALLFWTGNVYLFLQVVLLGINFIRPVQFGFNEQGEYFAGPARYGALILQILLFLGTGVNALIAAVRTDEGIRRRYYAIGAVGLFMSAAIVVQVLFPLQPLYTVDWMLGTCLLHTFVLGAEQEEHRRELADLLRREQEQHEALDAAQAMAHTDALTGVGNPHAYIDAQMDVDARIADGSLLAFAVVVFDVDRLKQINDTRGHEEGDRAICAASAFICRSFPHTPIYRVGGDEFVAILEGEDFHDRDALFTGFNAAVEENLDAGRVVVSAGMSDFRLGRDFACHTVFTRADKAMYERKLALHEREDAHVRS